MKRALTGEVDRKYCIAVHARIWLFVGVCVCMFVCMYIHENLPSSDRRITKLGMDQCVTGMIVGYLLQARCRAIEGLYAMAEAIVCAIS